MLLAIYLLLVVLLLLLNAFFVLAEFAVVKVRPTQIEALADKGDRRARIVQHIQEHLDVFLSVCQVGITLASIGLGFVGEPAFAAMLEPVLAQLGLGPGTPVAAHGLAITLSYAMVSFLHILLGELVPKSLALRLTVPAALFVAYPMTVFHYLFVPAIIVLNATVNAFLRLFRLPAAGLEADHSEGEMRIILGEFQEAGKMSFRRLLYVENVLDMGPLTVRNAMRPRPLVRCLQVGASRADVDRVVSECRYSRYPLLGDDANAPLGYIHVKDLFLARQDGTTPDDLRQRLRPAVRATEQQPLEQVLAEMQSKGNHLAVVYDRQGRWSGILTLEDAIEEVIGTIEEEFPIEPPVRLSDLLSQDFVLPEVEGADILAAARHALSRLPAKSLPLPVDKIMRQVADREKLGSSYLGRGLAIPHARIKGLVKPVVVLARLKQPIPANVADETIRLLFVLLTPADAPRIHQVLLSHIAGIFASSFIEDRLAEARTAAEMYSVICTTEQTALS